MIIDRKSIIDGLSNKAKDMLGIFNPSIVIVADADNVYDVRINLDSEKINPPHLISLSHDKDAGFFIDIDDATWEFQDNETLFRSEAIRLFEAIRNNKVKIVKKKLFKIITISNEAYIIG